jgi:hypothetical protein
MTRTLAPALPDARRCSSQRASGSKGAASAEKSPASRSAASRSRVTLQRAADGWALLRNGLPYTIHGAGGGASAATLSEIGGNSLRTWGVENAAETLAAARAHGLTVTLGLWLGQQGYMDYSKDTAALAQQRTMVTDAAKKFRDDPALLLWGLGNEMETGGDPGNPALWSEVDRLAQLIKSIDPDHPVMTVVAEVSPAKIDAIKRYAPNVDVLGVNSYGSAPSLPQRLKDYGWDKPYVITEFGPRGQWESPRTSWGAPYEPTSTAKEPMYRKAWEANVTNAAGRSLGGYAFTWGHKFEGSETWFGMFLPGTEEKLGAVDVMQQVFTGKPPAVPAPVMHSLESDATGSRVQPASKHHARVVATDAAGLPLSYRWEVRGEVAPPGLPDPPVVSGTVPARANRDEIEWTAPFMPGPYRLYVYVSDGQGKAATANVPFYVGPPQR